MANTLDFAASCSLGATRHVFLSPVAIMLLLDDPAWLTLYNPLRVIGLRATHPDFGMPADGVVDVARLPALEYCR